MRPTEQSAAIATLIEKCGSEDGKKGRYGYLY